MRRALLLAGLLFAVGIGLITTNGGAQIMMPILGSATHGGGGGPLSLDCGGGACPNSGTSSLNTATIILSTTNSSGIAILCGSVNLSSAPTPAVSSST